MTGRQILGIDLRATARTVELDDAHPQRIRGKTELAVDDRCVDFTRVAIVKQASFLVVLACRTKRMPAAIAHPLFLINLEIKVFSHPDASISVARHKSPVI